MTAPTSTAPARPIRPSRPSFPPDRLGGRLDREWATLRHDRQAIRTVDRWMAVVAEPQIRHPLRRTVAGRDLQVLVDATHAGAPGDPESVLRHLVGVAGEDRLAARIVLQRLLPGLVASAARYHRSFDGTDVLDHVVAAGWIAIHRFDLARRRGPAAPSLISDAVSIAYRGPMRRRAAHPEAAADPRAWDEVPMLDERSPLEELAALVAEGRSRGVAGRHLELIGQLVAAGSPSRLAAERGVTARTIRNRRDRAVDHLRHAVLEVPDPVGGTALRAAG